MYFYDRFSDLVLSLLFFGGVKVSEWDILGDIFNCFELKNKKYDQLDIILLIWSFFFPKNSNSRRQIFLRENEIF